MPKFKVEFERRVVFYEGFSRIIEAPDDKIAVQYADYLTSYESEGDPESFWCKCPDDAEDKCRSDTDGWDIDDINKVDDAETAEIVVPQSFFEEDEPERTIDDWREAVAQRQTERSFDDWRRQIDAR